MDSGSYLTALRRDGGLIADIAASTDLDTPVPTCPGWTLRDLIRHLGSTHRWAAAHVSPPRSGPMPADEEAALIASAPTEHGLVDWFRNGLAHLMQVLTDGDPLAEIWRFLPGSANGLTFWARRQAHETTVHRVDAQSIAGAITPVEPRFAVDGIDELLYGFFARAGRVHSPQSYAIALHPGDVEDRHWLVRVGPDGVSTTDDTGPADCAVHGPASDLYLLLWNRRDTAGLSVTGAAPVLDHWRENARVSWS
jgi:uncharacterized protein (TIGR03083 family)